MLTVNVDIQDRIKKLDSSDEEAGFKATKSSYRGRRNSWVSIKKILEAEIPTKKRPTFPCIKRNQFPLILVLAWASTVHKVEGLSLEQGVIEPKSIKQIYHALRRVKTYNV